MCRGALALGAPVGVGGAGEETGRLAVHNHECRRLGHGDLLHVQRVEIDAEGVPGLSARTGQRIEQSHMSAHAALGFLAVPGQSEGVGVVP